MSFDAKVLNVMVASPSDVEDERQTIRQILYEWNTINSQFRQLVLLPTLWESHAFPIMGDRPQEIINKQLLHNCDLLVAVFWTRIGTPTGEAESGTIEEIKKHMLANKPTMIYFSDVPISLNSVDQGQYHALCEFRDLCRQRGVIEAYSSIEEFKDKFTRQLSQTILNKFKDYIPAIAKTIIHENIIEVPTGWMS